jgi:hypothetical protein
MAKAAEEAPVAPAPAPEPMTEEDVAREKDKPKRAAPALAEVKIADTLHGKIAEVQGELGVMSKDRHVDVKGKNNQVLYGYDYLSESALMTAVRDKLSRRGVAVYISVVDQRREGQLTLVTTSITFADGPTGETFTITGQGQGADPSDKGVYKAITGAVRYMLWKTFLVPTEGDDPNQPHEVTAERSDAPVSVGEALPRIELFAGAAKPWVKEAVIAFYADVEDFEKVADLPDAIRHDLIRRLQRVVLELEGMPNFDPHADMEKTREVVRVAFAKAFDGLHVGGPDPFVGPVPF